MFLLDNEKHGWMDGIWQNLSQIWGGGGGGGGGGGNLNVEMKVTQNHTARFPKM